MPRIGRPGLTTAQKAELWARWKQGESLSDIGRALGKQAASVFGVLRANGGIYVPPRHRRDNALAFSEREGISRGLAAGRSIRFIAAELARLPSTVSREIARNGGPYRYRAADANDAAWDHARRPRNCKLAFNG